MRLTFLALALFLLAMSSPAHASIDQPEQFILESAESLSDSGLSEDEFKSRLRSVADLPAMANFTLGKYARRLSASDKERFHETFESWLMEQLLERLTAYDDAEISVLSADTRRPGDYIVTTCIYVNEESQDLVRWRILDRRGALKIVDLGIVAGDSTVWFGIEHRAQFATWLDRGNGSVEPLIQKLEG